VQAHLVGSIGAALALHATLTSAARPSSVNVGDSVSHAWQTSVVNGLGTRNIEELRGRPVLFDFWGTHCPPCVGAAVPASVKLQQTFGDDLQVVFVESQDATPDSMEGFCLVRRWLGTRAMWTCEQPFDSGARMLPYFVLVGNDGRVLLKGNPLEQGKEIERQIAEQIKSRKCAPSDAPASVQSAWCEFNAGRIARAFEALRGVERDGAPHDANSAAIERTAKTFRDRVGKDLCRVGWMIENGYFADASVRLDALATGAKGEDELYARCLELRRELEAPRWKSEREAGQALARALPAFYKSGGNAATTAELARIAETYKGTKAALRAEHLANLPRN
jgi:thiol-disulfide isomerase/thioredoxin